MPRPKKVATPKIDDFTVLLECLKERGIVSDCDLIRKREELENPKE